MQEIEDRILTEARRQGYQPNEHAMRQVAIDLAGCTISNGMIIMPGGRASLHPLDFVRSLQASMPEAFETVAQDRQSDESRYVGKTAEMLAERQQADSSDFEARRQRAVGFTRECMDAIAAQRGGR